MSITILGEHITIIRPRRVSRPIIGSGDRPRQKPKNQKPLTVKEHTGKVTAIVVETTEYGGTIVYSLPAPTTHKNLINIYKIDQDKITRLGYKIGREILWLSHLNY